MMRRETGMKRLLLPLIVNDGSRRSPLAQPGDPSYTAIASFCFSGNGGSDSTGFAGFFSGLIRNQVLDLRFWSSSVQFLSVDRVFIGFGLQGGVGSRFDLNPAEAVVVFWWMSDYCGDGGCMPVKGWGFDRRTLALLMVIRSKHGGLVTRVPCSEDFNTCPVSCNKRE
ncbi:hypothetical protein HID58_093637 [Brassica napus]|uniref:Uncharacterized protein n=1 Tax=Brassica napus TaxID=3708 RepID=A0ABQ7X6K9_BRANA|nr:hypothetical protein HID58_091022 [Brassica napus]KAH0852888.1 hypothetical protein HID58_093637 [Brassica napus]